MFGEILADGGQNVACDADGVSIVWCRWVRDRVEDDVLELDAVAGGVGEDAHELLDDPVGGAAQGEGVGVGFAEEIDRSPGLEQVGIVMKVGPDVALPLEQFGVGAVPS